MKQQSADDGWWQFLELCTSLKNKNNLDELFTLLLTHDEREDIAGRYLIIRELLKGELTQREMADQLGVSIAKITRGSNFLKITGEGLRKILKSKMT